MRENQNMKNYNLTVIEHVNSDVTEYTINDAETFICKLSDQVNQIMLTELGDLILQSTFHFRHKCGSK